MKTQAFWRLAATLAFVCAGTASAETNSSTPSTPYAGQQHRAIKSLSDSDVAGLLAGSGAALAKAAELNGYPGPAHVLELAQALQLTEDQATATRFLMDQHKQKASRLGAALLEAERQLDNLFAKREATAAAVDKATARVGELQALLRAEHLKTHLAQTELLTAHQTQRYASLRGYGSDPIPAVPAPHRNPSSTHTH